jgi:signal transduction histidine kinase
MDSDVDGENDTLVALRAEVAALRLRLAGQDQRTCEFLARLAHELRTPLGAILMWAHVLRLGRDADRDAAIDAIETSAHTESKMIGRLLDVSRASAGRLKIGRSILDLRVPVLEAIEEHRSEAQVRGVGLEVAIGDAPTPVTGDAGRIREIVANLVSNGIKFTPSGGKVSVLLTNVDRHTRVSVIDSGFGFEPGELPDVFTAFRGEGDAELRTGKGLGLGLALARLLTELHGGTIRLSSGGRGRGTTFTVDLPLAHDR